MNAVALPLIIPLVTACICLLVRDRSAVLRGVSVVGALLLLSSAVSLLPSTLGGAILVLQTGLWEAPFGISLVIDALSAIMLTLTGIIGLAGVVYAAASIDPDRERFGFHSLLHMMLMGVCGAFTTGDLFNLFVWFEVLLISSFVLLALGSRVAQLEGALKYVAINLFSSVIFLAALGLIFGTTGSLNMAELATKFSALPDLGFLHAVSMLFLVAFGVKAAIFPFYFWLPSSYHTPPPVVSAIFAGLLTKVGVYAFYRMFTLVFVADVSFSHYVLLWLGGLTMLLGVWGAFAQNNFRKVLSVHIVSQVGYLIVGLALFTIGGLAAGFFHMVHNMVVKTNLFFIAGAAAHLCGADDLSKQGGLLKRAPWLAWAFALNAAALIGFPPLSGFFGKLGLVSEGLRLQQYGPVALMLFVSFFTMLSMLKIWNECFWRPSASPQQEKSTVPLGMRATIAAMSVAVVLLTVLSGPLYRASQQVGTMLMDREPYIQAVLGGASVQEVRR